MFVGRGAARIRRLFKEARKAGRAVIFIDELDAIGGSRSGGGGDGGTSEREQALNQLLVELDGFEKDPGMVIVIAASNYVDKLDKAPLRPGRFDRRVLVAPPDRKGREVILRSHAKNKPLAPDLDLRDVARKTTGMTGAQLPTRSTRARSSPAVRAAGSMTREDLDEALLRQAVGSQQARRLSGKERRIVAYHEAGHALRRSCSASTRRRSSASPPRPRARLRRPLATGGQLPEARDELLDEVVTCPAAAPPRRSCSARSRLRRRRRPQPGAPRLQADGLRIRDGGGGRPRRAAADRDADQRQHRQVVEHLEVGGDQRPGAGGRPRGRGSSPPGRPRGGSGRRRRSRRSAGRSAAARRGRARPPSRIRRPSACRPGAPG